MLGDNPELIPLFKLDDVSTAADVPTSQAVKKQATVVTGFLSKTVEALGDMPALSKRLQTLGSKHYTYGIKLDQFAVRLHFTI